MTLVNVTESHTLCPHIRIPYRPISAIPRYIPVRRGGRPTCHSKAKYTFPSDV